MNDRFRERLSPPWLTWIRRGTADGVDGAKLFDAGGEEFIRS
jgi:hypothetical protein